MSFLNHDMTPRDTAEYFGPRAKGDKRDPSELRQKRVQPRVPETADPVLTSGVRGRNVDHFNAGLNLDGSVAPNRSRSTSVGAVGSRRTSTAGKQQPADSAESAIHGTPSKTKTKTTYQGLDVHNTTTESRRQQEQKMKAEMREAEKRQLAEREARRKSEVAENNQPIGWVLEDASKKPAVKLPSNPYTLFGAPASKSDHANPPPTHKHSLEDHVQASPKNQQYLDDLRKQQEEDRRRRSLQQEEEKQQGATLDEVIKTQSKPAKRRPLSIEEQEHRRAEAAQLEQRRLQLERQIQEVSLRDSEEPTPVATKVVPRGSLKKPLKPEDVKKVNDEGREAALYEAMANSDKGVLDAFGTDKKPKATHAAVAVVEDPATKLAKQQQYRSDLDKVKDQRLSNEAKQREREADLAKMQLTSDPFHAKSHASRPSKLRKGLDAKEAKSLDEKAKYQQDLKHLMNEKEQQKTRARQAEKQVEKQLNESDPIQWNKDAKIRAERKAAPRKIDPQIERQNKYLQDLNQQTAHNRALREQEKSARAAEEKQHIESGIAESLKEPKVVLFKDNSSGLFADIGPTHQRPAIEKVKGRARKDNVKEMMR